MEKKLSQEEIIQKLDRIIELTDKMEKRLDSLLKHIEEFSKPMKIVTNVNDGPIMFSQKRREEAMKEDSNIMKKFNEWMLRKDPKNDTSIFDGAEGDEDNF